MQGRSIRSFTLDYYRKQGAAVRPLEGTETSPGAADAYEIVSAQGNKLAVTFSADASADEGAGLVPLTATSPQYRAIIEDLTAGVAVSYRYLVSGPIANAVKTLEAAMPTGWRVLEAKLKHVDNRPALGFTHRVTFDSPALGACQEAIHHHVWDVALGDRLPAVEPLLYQLPCILLRPDHLPSEVSLQHFLARTISVVDVASDAQGLEIERELAGLLVDVEKRTNQYFEQQMANVLQREVQLTEKLDGTIRRLTEAKTPEQIARYRQDGEALGQQLEHMKVHRERDLAAIEAACMHKLETEHERHELTATTDLVALCHATYDVLTYQTKLVSPAGHEVSWTLNYWPITRDLRFPNCPSCERPMADPQVLAASRYACVHCTTACEGCGAVHERDRLISNPCASCQAPACQACETLCHACGASSCLAHATGCATCEAPVCGGCGRACASCDSALCEAHAHGDAASGQYHCEAHRPVAPVAPAAPRAIAPAAERTLRVVVSALPLTAPASAPATEPLAVITSIVELPVTLPAPEVVAGPVPLEPPVPAVAAAEIAPVVAFAPAPAPAPIPGRVAVSTNALDAIGAMELAPDMGANFLTTGPLPARDVDAELDRVDASAFERLFGGPIAPTKPIKAAKAAKLEKAAKPDKALQAAKAAPQIVQPALAPAAVACPACEDSLAYQTPVVCETCGVPCCAACAEGELAPCPTCGTLEEADADDRRLAFVFKTFPALAKKRCHWALAEQGPYVVAHWRQLGAWGIVSYHRGGNAPSLVSEFACGPIASLRGWFGGRG